MWRLTLVITAVGRQEDYCQFKLSLILIASPRLIGLRGKLYLKKKRGLGGWRRYRLIILLTSKHVEKIL